MTTISELRQAYRKENLDATSLKDSMADMMNELVKTNKQGSNIGNEEMGEDFVYTSLVYDQLKKQDASLAETFKSKIATVFNRLNDKSRRESQPLFKATNRVLRTMVRAGDLTKKINKVMKRIALGKSQLDKKPNRLRRAPIVIDNSETKNNVEEIIDRIGKNRVASNATLEAIVARNARKTISVEAWERKKDFLDGLKAAPIEEKKVGSVASVSDVEEKKVNVFKGTTNDMVFDPKSEYGKPVFILPHLYSNVEKVADIKMETTDGVPLGDFTYGGTEEGIPDSNYARKFYYFSHEMTLPSKINILMRFEGTDEWFYQAFDTREMHTIRYRSKSL
jgi:hypothetical protein